MRPVRGRGRRTEETPDLHLDKETLEETKASWLTFCALKGREAAEAAVQEHLRHHKPTFGKVVCEDEAEASIGEDPEGQQLKRYLAAISAQPVRAGRAHDSFVVEASAALSGEARRQLRGNPFRTALACTRLVLLELVDDADDTGEGARENGQTMSREKKTMEDVRRRLLDTSVFDATKSDSVGRVTL